jgi:hypothetical protein
MSFPKRVPARALVSTIKQRPSQPSTVRAAALQPTRRASTDQKPNDGTRSFKGQLYKSTEERLAKERADMQRFASERNEGAGGRNAALTFSKNIIRALLSDVVIYTYTYWLTCLQRSSRRDSSHLLLPRNQKFPETVNGLHPPSCGNETPKT